MRVSTESPTLSYLNFYMVSCYVKAIRILSKPPDGHGKNKTLINKTMALDVRHVTSYVSLAFFVQIQGLVKNTGTQQ